MTTDALMQRIVKRFLSADRRWLCELQFYRVVTMKKQTSGIQQYIADIFNSGNLVHHEIIKNGTRGQFIKV